MSDPASAGTWPERSQAARWPLRVACALALALPLLWQLGGTPLFDVDEGAFSEATREMLASGDWGHTTLNGAPRFDKPIGVYWLQALAVQIFGFNEFALRLPSAASGWAMALALWTFAARRWGEPAGMLAGLLTVTSLGVQAISRGATADGLLNLLLVLAGLDLWRHIESGGDAPLRRAYAWVGLGLLVKGPIAILVPGAAFALWCVCSGRWRLLGRAASDIRGWVLLLGIAAPWYAYALHRHGMAFVDGFVMRHNIERFTGTLQGHSGTPLYYLVVLPLLAMPWTPLLVAVAARAKPLWAEPLARYLLGWSAFVLAFFSLSGTKLPHYLLYGYAPLVLLMARMFAQAGPRLRVAVVLCLVGWTVAVAASPWVLQSFAPAIRDPLYRALFVGAASPSPWPPLAAGAALLALLLWPGARDRLLPRAAAMAAVLAWLLASWVLPWYGEALQGPVRRAAAVAVAQGGRAVQWQLHLPSFAVYAAQEAPLRAPHPDEMALSRVDRLPPGDDGRPRLFEERGIVLLGPQASTEPRTPTRKAP